MFAILFAHFLQLLHPGVNRLPADAQDLGDVSDATKPDLLRFDRCVAPPVIFRQRTKVRSHLLFVGFFVAGEVVHAGAILSF